MQKFIKSLLRDEKIRKHEEYLGAAPALPARYGTPASGWPAGAREALLSLGIRQVYSHQAEAQDLVCQGHNTLLATPTASGKTLAYLLGFLALREKNPQGRAIFIYPLKALARDQLAAIRRFLAPLGLAAEEAAQVYDGDTPEAERRRIRKSPPTVLLTNPDMIHMGILPSHETWAGFLSELVLVVVDEAHTYRGIFGAHVHHVLRRLGRLAGYHSAAPRWLAGSATIGDPQGFVETLFGEPFRVVRDSGAPASTRHILFLVPDFESPYGVATRVFQRAVEAGHRTIAFTKARRITELMHQWLRQESPALVRRVASYRSGYLPEERREIERRLFSGELGGVISTSALEAGIDVGGLDVCLLVGYPGSLANAWQRIGRTGRSDRESLAVLVALPDALDRYVVRHPEHFFSGEFERVVLDPQNDTIVDLHLQAAGAELSLDPAAVAWLCRNTGLARLRRLVDQGHLVEVDGEQRWFSRKSKPQRDIPLRSAGTPYSLVLARTGRCLGSLDGPRVWFEGHPGAIYLHAGQTYRVLSLDPEQKAITLEQCEVDYYTQVYARKETEVLERFGDRPLGPARLAWGRVRVTTVVEGYSKRRIRGQDEISRHPLEAPPQEMETVAFWVEFPGSLGAWLAAGEYDIQGSLHALEHAAIGLFPLLAICDRWDLGGISYAQYPQFDRPTVFVYDGWPGGVGLARTGFLRAEELFGRTLELLETCPCEEGCPACIHSPKCGSGNTPLDKEGAIAVLAVLAGKRTLEGGEAAREKVALALARHRKSVHPGVRGGEALPAGFFAAPSRPIASPAAGVLEEGAGETLPTDSWWPEGLSPPGRLLRPEEGRWLFFDLETLRGAEEVGGWQNIREMGLALAVTLEGRTGEFTTYREGDARRLAEDLLAADQVVGFNLDRFDLTVLEPYAGQRIRRVKSLDLLSAVFKRMGFRLGLGHLAAETLGRSKSADGLQSLDWVRQGRWELIEQYCREDVALTAALWAFGREKGYVLYKNRRGERGRIPCTW